MNSTFYWHDYETFGINPGTDRISQFAGIRTDQDLNPIGEALVEYCRPADDFLPDPGACLVTGISPQLCLKEGLAEYQFVQKIHHQLATPNTCTVGYNNIRFDDEFSRFSFYRNFIDPYAREWQNGNSRWDIIDVARITSALRPDGINWPINDEGKKSFRLELLTEANGISHQNAHDALSDVYATIAFAKLIKEKQPRLFDFCLDLRNKHTVSKMLNYHNPTPLIHVSGMYPSEYEHCAIVLPLVEHPENKNGIIVFDCRYDPSSLADLSIEEIQTRLFTSSKQLQQMGLERIALKTIHINKCPAIAPINTLDNDAQERAQINLSVHLNHAEKLQRLLSNNIEFKHKLSQVFISQYESTGKDPDAALYTGGFFSPYDRQQMNTIIATSDSDIVNLNLSFQDKRLDDLFFRYLGRNFKSSLDKEQLQRWESYRLDRLQSEQSPSQMNVNNYQQAIKLAFGSLSEQERLNKEELLQDLLNYPDLIGLIINKPDNK